MNITSNPVRPVHSVRTFIILGFILLIAISTGIAVYLLRQQTNNRSKAAASTTLSFTPGALQVGVGQTASSEVFLNPGSNQVSIMKLVLTYDSTKFDQNSAAISPHLVNPSGTVQQGFVQIVTPQTNTCTGTTCTLSMTLSISNLPTFAITQQYDAATVSLKAIAQTTGTATAVAVDPSTQVLSLAPSDQPSENVLLLSSLAPLLVTIGNSSITPTPPLCVPNQSTCQWDAVPSVVSYHYKVTKYPAGDLVVEGDVFPPSQTIISFPSAPGNTYKCSVTATNACQATSSAGQTVQTCPVIPTPSPTICPSPGTVANLRLLCPNCGN